MARLAAIACLLLSLVTGGAAYAATDTPDATADGTEIFVEAGTRVADVLRALTDLGARIVWSEVLVRRWMRVGSDATYATPVEALRGVLAPFQLTAERGPGNTWLVVRDEARDTTLELGGVHGRVVDASTGAGIRGAVVQVERGDTVASAADGRFRVSPLPAGEYLLRVEARNYVGLTRRVRAGGAADNVVLALAPDFSIGELALEDVLVVASRYDLYGARSASSHFLSREQIDRLPHLADDSNRALHRLPGVAAGDWSARFHLRGGLENEVSLVVDGFELFDPFHMKDLFSPLSMIDANVIENTELYSGGFGARYGDHMSGVIYIDTLDAGAERESEIGVSFVNAYARTQGSFSGERGRWLLSARRGYLDLLVDQVDSVEGDFTPRYHDVFAKARYDVNDRVSIAAHLLFARDDVDYVQDDFDTLDGEGRSSYAWVTVEQDLSDTLSGTTLFSVGQVERDSLLTEETEPSGEFSYADNFREVRVVGLRSDWEWLVSDRHMLSWGAELRNLDANYDYFLDALDFDVLFNDGQGRAVRRTSDVSPDGDEIGAWAAHRYRLSDRVVWETGLRWDKQTYTDLAGQEQWSPRLNLLWGLGDATELRFAWGRYFQPQRIDELQVEDGVESFFPVQRSTHSIVSLTHRFESGSILRAEAYQKDYDSVRPRYENVLNRYETVAEVQPDRVRIAPESSLARGVEVSFRQQLGAGWDWWAAYAWARVEDRVDGRDVPRNWDQRNALTAALNWRNERWNVNMTLNHHSGWPISELEGEVTFDDDGNAVGAAFFDELNGERLSAYNRVDLRVTRSVPVRRGEFRWFLEVYNLFDAGNDCCVVDVTLFGSIDGGVNAQPQFDPWMPRLPSFGFSWTF